MNVIIQSPEPDFQYGTVVGAPRSDGKTFLVFIYIWQENDAKIPQMPGAQRNVNPALAITWFAGVTPIVPFFNHNSTPPTQLLRNKILLKKKISKGNAY